MCRNQDPGGLTLAEIRHAGGAIARAPEHPSSYGNRDRLHLLQVVGATPTAEARVALAEAIGELRAKLAPSIAGGAYLNFLEGTEKVRRYSEGFEPEAWSRLLEVKKSFDPDNLFSHGLDLAQGEA